jgi:hypothetical protein
LVIGHWYLVIRRFLAVSDIHHFLVLRGLVDQGRDVAYFTLSKNRQGDSSDSESDISETSSESSNSKSPRRPHENTCREPTGRLNCG